MKTPYPDLNAVLHDLVTSVQQILQDNFIGAYLQGSFAHGDFDEHSDVDFLVVTEDAVTESQEADLQTMHERIYKLESPWAQHLEGSYFPKDILKRYSPMREALLYIDNGSNTLIRSQHDNTQVVRWVTRECGVTLAGPEPKDLIDPVTPEALREEVTSLMLEWGHYLLTNPSKMNTRWYQPFVVLSYCRMLHTLHTGMVTSKPVAARWAKENLDARWSGLIGRAWAERPNPSLKVRQKADTDDLADTVLFINYALNYRDS